MTSTDDFKAIRLYRAFNTTLQMCLDRGYTIKHPKEVAEIIQNTKKEELKQKEQLVSFTWFKEQFAVTDNNNNNTSFFREKMKISCAEENDTNDEKSKTVFVVYFIDADEEKINSSFFQKYRTTSLEKKYKRVLLVFSAVQPSKVLRIVHQLNGLERSEENNNNSNNNNNVYMEVMAEEQLCFNITRHETVPAHRLLSETEKKQFLQERNIDIAQLPRMLSTDPIAVYYGLRRGDVVHIHRPMTAETDKGGFYDMYRQII